MYEFLDYPVQDVMNRPLMVTADTTLAEVELLLEKHGYNALPVVDDDRVVGMVAREDVMLALRRGTGGRKP